MFIIQWRMEAVFCYFCYFWWPVACISLRGTGNGERETGNGKRETGNGKRETGNGKRETGKGKRRTGNGNHNGKEEPRTGNAERGTWNWCGTERVPIYYDEMKNDSPFFQIVFFYFKINISRQFKR